MAELPREKCRRNESVDWRTKETIMEENPSWKIIRSLERKINWPRTGQSCRAVATIAKRWSNGWGIILSRASEIGEARADKRTSDRLNPMNERDIDEARMAPLRDYPSPGTFRDDGTRFLIFLHGSTRSPLIGNRCAFNLHPPPHPWFGFLHRLLRLFSDTFGYYVFHVSREIDSHEERGFLHVTSKELRRIIGNGERGNNPSSYRASVWNTDSNKLELAWFNFAFERAIYRPFLGIFKSYLSTWIGL